MAQETIQNVRVGSGEVLWGTKNLGFTTDAGAVLNITMEKVDIKVDAFGDSIVDQIVNGYNATIEVVLMETANENITDVWSSVFPAKGSGSGADRLDIKYADVRNKSMRSLAQVLRIRTRNAEGATADEDFILWKAAPMEVGDIEIKNDVRTLKVKFQGYLDDAGKLFTFGDSLS